MRGIKELEQLMAHSMDEKVSIISRTQSVAVTNAGLCDNMGPGKAPGNVWDGKCFVCANGEWRTVKISERRRK